MKNQIKVGDLCRVEFALKDDLFTDYSGDLVLVLEEKKVLSPVDLPGRRPVFIVFHQKTGHKLQTTSSFLEKVS